MSSDQWFVYRTRPYGWFASAPINQTAYHSAGPFPTWREAYDYAHTHPSNRKETP